MRKLLFLLLLCSNSHLYAQHAASLDKAKAFEQYLKKAQEGDARAMNGVAMCYNLGLGVPTDKAQALAWFGKAAQRNYPNAWYNLGLMHKNGTSTPQDFKEAYDCFAKAANLEAAWGYYALGYMHYKGLGCAQSYSKAIEFLKKANAKEHGGGMYLLGLCYRNGYGTPVNADSASYWLTKASVLGWGPAKLELRAKEPESIEMLVSAKGAIQGKSNPGPANYASVKHRVQQEALDGAYTGYLIKYDWSGKQVVSQSRLTLQFKLTGKNLTGLWIENDSIQTPVQAVLTDTAVVFTNTTYSQKDHYNRYAPNSFEFRGASLRLVEYGDSVFLVGNLKLFSLVHNEPEKPTYITLVRGKEESSWPQSALTRTANPAISSGEREVLLAYPNPFNNEFQVSFKLLQRTHVTLSLIDLKGKVVYQETGIDLEAGAHTRAIAADVAAGTYLVRLYGEDLNMSTLVIKQ